MKTRFTALALLIAIISALASCGETGNAATQTTTASATASDTTQAPETSEFTASKEDYGGIDFIIAENDVGDWMQSAFITEENGDILNDSIYKRNQAVNELYNIKIKGYKIQGNRNSQQLTELTQSILAGDKEFDVAYIPGQLTPVILNNPDYLVPLSDVETLDLSHSWWDKGSVDAMTIKGKTIIATGDLIVSTTGASTITIFNKNVAEKYKLDMYSLVREGKFTLDKAHELANTVKSDINGDSKYDPLVDTYGLCFESLNLPQMVLASGERLTKTNSEGVPELALGTAKVADVVQKFMAVIDDRDCVVSAQDNRMSADISFATIFNSDNLFMWVTNLQRMKQARGFNADFGLIPFPKYEEANDYIDPVNEYWSSWLIIPATNTDTDRTGTILEALGYYSQQYVTPAFIETAVTTKALRDDESAEMLELILNKKVFDIGSFFDWGYRLLFNLANTHSSNIASALAENSAKIEASIDSFVTAFSETK